MAELTFAQVDALLKYEPETGKFFWKKRPVELFKSPADWMTWNTRFAEKEAFKARQRKGYYSSGIFGKTYLAHRVAWLLTTGQWPEGHIDHIDGNEGNNAIANLRDVSHQENVRKQKKRSTNKSGANGVWFAKAEKKWCAGIYTRGKQHNLGYFDNFDEAVAARAKADMEWGFHPSHGR